MFSVNSLSRETNNTMRKPDLHYVRNKKGKIYIYMKFLLQ